MLITLLLPVDATSAHMPGTHTYHYRRAIRALISFHFRWHRAPARPVEQNQGPFSASVGKLSWNRVEKVAVWRSGPPAAGHTCRVP